MNLESFPDVVFQVARRSMTDLRFRETAISDPQQAIAEILGREVALPFSIVFVEPDRPILAQIALPPMIGEELDVVELLIISGGGTSCHANKETFVNSDTTNHVTVTGVPPS